MIDDFQFALLRKSAFAEWSGKSNIPDISQEMLLSSFADVLAEQDADGSWQAKDHPAWTVVQTAVVLRGLACLRFRPDDTWNFSYKESTVIGGVKQALAFIVRQFETVSPPNHIGEDVWDTCQVLLALEGFGLQEKGKQYANHINDNWETYYQHALDQKDNRWRGPAFLAAMADVLSRYRMSNLSVLLMKLKSLKRQKNCPFPAQQSDTNINRWTTGLVLRSLSSMPEVDGDLQMIEHVANWLSDEFTAEKRVGWEGDKTQAAMYLARGLEGLHAAVNRVSRTKVSKIAAALSTGNQWLHQLWDKKEGSLKTRTVACEYLAGLTISAPAGLLVEVGKLLLAQQASPSPTSTGLSHRDRKGGLRIAWLSDLHLAQSDDKEPGVFNGIKYYINRYFMHLRGNPLTQHFQQARLTNILDRVAKLKPDHILVTGDVTNFAQPGQFKSARDLFMTTQSTIWGGGATHKLDKKYWTILPGNHDASDKDGRSKLRGHLNLFFDHFKDVYGSDGADLDNLFPFHQELGGNNGKLGIRLITLDSTCPWPVWAVGVNARGRIDESQFTRLGQLLTEKDSRLTLVALHHHPIVVPQLVSSNEDYFLSLQEAHGRKLIALCAEQGVAAVLHGHFHCFSEWSCHVPGAPGMSVIGAPSGTMGAKEFQEEFLELREADIETPTGKKTGLAVYLQRRKPDEKWDEAYLTFIG